MDAIDKHHACNSDVTNETREAHFGIRWLRGDAFRPGGKIKKVWFGVCGYSHRVCRVSGNFIDTIIFNGVYVDEGRCEDATSCLAKSCPLSYPASRNSTIWTCGPKQLFERACPINVGTCSIGAQPAASTKMTSTP